jgi:LPXTG-motif cell wall-anchored protein
MPKNSKKGMIQMKKVLALIMCVAMIACIAVTASADATATVTIGNVEGKVGDIVDVTISISEGSDLGALQMNVIYDDTKLAPATKLDKRGNPIYFVSGDAATAAKALVEAANGGCPWNIGTITTDGYWEGGVIWTLFFEIVADLGEDGTPITAEVTAVQDYADAEKAVTVDVVAGSVAHPYVAPPVEPSKPSKPESKPESKPVEPSVDDNDEPVVDEPVVEEDVTVNDVTVTDTDMPKTGDASSVAIAAGLCAVAAAAFVITKKVND